MAYEYNASGQMTAASAGGTRQEWEREGGFVTGHLVRQGGVISHTAVGRDETGRVAWTSRDGSHTAYTYDGANQLTQVQTEDATAGYVWDDAGRLVSETTTAGGRVDYTYDRAGQLTATSTGGDVSVRYSYDAAGQRVREEHADGTVRAYQWDAAGRLETVSIDSALERSRTSLFTDALGELAAIDGQYLFWDTAAGLPALLSAGGQDVVSVPGFTATVDGWQAPGWRQARTTTSGDPWATTTGTSLPTTGGGMPGGGVLLGAVGELLLPGGLELLGARVYDPSSRGFLSPDPQDPTSGAGWVGNGYAYAGNNPVGFTDPTGLHPLSDAEFDQWKEQHKSTLAKAGDWLGDNWEYIAAGAMVVAGVALMFTGVGGAAGVALMSLSGALTSGGISVAQQKHENGSVDLGAVGKEMAIGAIPIPGGSAAKGAGAIGRETAEAVGREALETTGREAAEQAARSTGRQHLDDIGKTAADAVGDDTARAAHNVCSNGNCFVADTPVLMADGTAKPIQDVRVGDEVVAYDPDTDTTRACTVTNTYVHEQVETLVVTLEDGGSVETTAGHPFWTQDRGWTPAAHLHPGDQLHGPDGTWVTVATVEATGRACAVYNFEVEELHAYHVRAGGTWTTVHNMCPKTGNGDHSWFPKRELPKDKNGIPVPDSKYPHTQLGTKNGRNGSYPQAREFGENGELVRDIDFTDHGRPGNHSNPHQHRWLPNETGGSPKRGWGRALVEPVGGVMELRFPMFRDGKMLSFLEVLSHIDGRGLFWNISNLWVQVKSDSKLNILKIEEQSKLSPSPLWLTWFQLLFFGTETEQVIDGDFTGYSTSDEISREPIVVITAFDSTEWSISTSRSSCCDLNNSFDEFYYDDVLSDYK